MSNTQNSSSDVQQTAEKELLANFEAKHKVQKSSFVFSDEFRFPVPSIFVIYKTYEETPRFY